MMKECGPGRVELSIMFVVELTCDIIVRIIKKGPGDNISLFNFYVLLTVRLDAILGNDKLDALFLNVSILCLYMFRAASAHHQEGQIVLIHHLV
jgi:hypothetical protein